MYCYSMDYNYDRTKVETNSRTRGVTVSNKTICEWFNCCRETVAVYEIENQQKREMIGGPGKIVHIDGSEFGKRKYKKGRHLEGHWILGMIDDETNEIRFEVCTERSAEALTPLIKKHVKEGSIIYTDYWSAYDSLSTYGYYIHNRVYNSDPDNPSETDAEQIQSQWRHFKTRFHKVRYSGNFEDWLVNYLWRNDIRKNCLDAFEELLKIVKNVYKF